MDRREALRLIGTTAAIPVFAGLSPERLWAIAEGAHLRSASAAGRVLDAHQLETVATIAEHVLPRTGTPGARDAGIPAFIDLLLDEWYDEARSEERRVGKECRYRRSAYHDKKNQGHPRKFDNVR